MNAPRPVPRLTPMGLLMAIWKARMSRLGSAMSSGGSSRTLPEQLGGAGPARVGYESFESDGVRGALELAHQPVDASRAPGPPSGASMSTKQVMRPARRSAMTWIGATACGMRIAPVSSPVVDHAVEQRLGTQCRLRLLPAAEHGQNFRSELSAETQARVAQQRVEPADHLGGGLVCRPKGAGRDRLTDRHPVLAHVLELHGTGARVLQVADQLTEDPRLLGVGDTAVLLLHHGGGQEVGPGPVVQRRPSRSFRLSTLVGCWPAIGGISLLIVMRASKPCSRAMSR